MAAGRIVGMSFMFYFSSFVGQLRSLLRPGVLWFLRNASDPAFNPIQEMVRDPCARIVFRTHGPTT
jgi:E3 ubiquitin-protein ligase MARCH6